MAAIDPSEKNQAASMFSASLAEADPELARIAKQNPDDLAATMAAPLTPLPKEHELKTLERTKTMLKLRSVLMAIAIFFTLLPMACYQIGRHRWAMLSDFPGGAIACGVTGVLGMSDIQHFFIPEPTARAAEWANLAPTAFATAIRQP